ncbi:MAG TPA: hypothetical protein DCO77_05980 [Nitrospiraceae bacterium]|nr:hypothetical protein [Nitrospiraceae bacterium]
MRHAVRLLIVVPLFFSYLLVSCAPMEPSHPQPDPTQEQISLLQKQLLEMQKVQNDTRSKLDEILNSMSALSARIKKLEGKRSKPRQKKKRRSKTKRR